MSHHFNIETRLLFVPSFVVTWSRVADSETWLLQFHKRKADKMFVRFFFCHLLSFLLTFHLQVFFFLLFLFLLFESRDLADPAVRTDPAALLYSSAPAWLFKAWSIAATHFQKYFLFQTHTPPHPPTHLASLITVQYWFCSFKMH